MACEVCLTLLIITAAGKLLTVDAQVLKVANFTSVSSSFYDKWTVIALNCSLNCSSSLPPRIKLLNSFDLTNLEGFKLHNLSYYDAVGNELPPSSMCTGSNQDGMTIAVIGAIKRNVNQCCYSAECTGFDGSLIVSKVFTFQDCLDNFWSYNDKMAEVTTTTVAASIAAITVYSTLLPACTFDNTTSVTVVTTKTITVQPSVTTLDLSKCPSDTYMFTSCHCSNQIRISPTVTECSNNPKPDPTEVEQDTLIASVNEVNFSSTTRGKDNQTNITVSCTLNCSAHLPPRIKIFERFDLDNLAPKGFEFFKQEYYDASSGNLIENEIPQKCTGSNFHGIIVTVHGAISRDKRNEQPCCYNAECTDFNGDLIFNEIFSYEDCVLISNNNSMVTTSDFEPSATVTIYSTLSGTCDGISSSDIYYTVTETAEDSFHSSCISEGSIVPIITSCFCSEQISFSAGPSCSNNSTGIEDRQQLALILGTTLPIVVVIIMFGVVLTLVMIFKLRPSSNNKIIPKFL